MVDAISAVASSSAATVSHAESWGDTITSLEVDAERGLTAGQVQDRRARFGANQLAEAPPVLVWRKVLAQFKDLVIWILIVAAVISGVLGEWVDTMAILAIVLLNGVIGFFQEERAERALAALQKLSAPMAKVVREGVLRSMPASELVPGDIIELEAGDNIPADARLLQAFSLHGARGGTHRRVGPGRKRCGGCASGCDCRWATGATWSTWGPWPQREKAEWSLSPPACTRSWAASPACSSAMSRSRLRSNAGWPNWAECWSSSAW